MAIAGAGGAVVGANSEKLATIASYRMPEMAASSQLINFDMAGVAVSAGSACSSGTLKTSHVLGAMGWDNKAASEVIRVSFRSCNERGGNWPLYRSLAKHRRAGQSRMIYLDYQATTPLAPEAFAAMEPWLKDNFWNPHSAHAGGRKAAAAVEVAREQVAALLPTGGRVIFTSGATEAINLAIKGCGLPVRASATEHAAVLDCVEILHGETLAVDEAGILPNPFVSGEDGTPEGRAQPMGLSSTLEANGLLLAVMLINNEIGTIQPVADLAVQAHEQNALFLCDAVQAYGRISNPRRP